MRLKSVDGDLTFGLVGQKSRSDSLNFSARSLAADQVSDGCFLR
jgi:hypothetical protein